MKFVSLISSGIDSPVATYLISRYADEIVMVHGDCSPFTDKRELDNFKKLNSHLKKQIKIKTKVFLISHGENLDLFKKNCNNRYTCVFCKRMLLRYAEKIAEIEGADAIVMGDSLGQVASQTIQNIKTIEQSVKTPVLRPLIGLDKEDVIKIAKEIKSYDLSILPSSGCNAVPKKPSTAAKIEDILLEENKLDIDSLVNNAVKNAKIVNI